MDDSVFNSSSCQAPLLQLRTLFVVLPGLVAEHLRHEGQQFAKGCNVCYLAGRNMLDPADHAAWQASAYV